MEHEKTVYTESLELQMNLVESEYQRLQNDLLNIVVSETPYNLLKELDAGSEYNFQKVQMNKVLREKLEGYAYMNGLFILDTDTGQTLIQYDSTEDYGSMGGIREQAYTEARTLLEAGDKQSGNLAEVNGKWYYIYLFSDDRMILGGWSELTQIFEFMKSVQPVWGYKVQLGDVSLAREPEGKDLFDVETAGKISGVEYSLSFSRSALYGLVIQTMRWDVVLSVLGFALIAAVLLGIRRMVLSPVRYMEQNLKKIGEGELKLRLSNSRHPSEYQMLYESFNQMLDQVEQLKIRVYEEQMEKQRTQMAYLTMQMNPHFYVNTLNVIHSLAQMKNYALIEQMAQCLSGYFNYIFRTDMESAVLADELSNLMNYLKIQKIRYAEKLSVETEIDGECLDARIPVLLIHTFAENSVKYCGISIGSLQMTLRIKREADGEHIEIIWTDNGEGFPEEILKKLNAGEKIVKPDGEHIGISNLAKRAAFFYDGDFMIRFRNVSAGGAEIRIRIPYKKNTAGGGTDDGTDRTADRGR